MENIQTICSKVRNATYKLSLYDTKMKNEILLAIAKKIQENNEKIKQINAIDIENAKGKLSEAMIDRLTLTDSRIALMAEGVRQVADLADPVGTVVRQWKVESGLEIKKVRAPLGVIGVIYESRPNVTVDVASLCIKSGNGVILKGGKEAINTNRLLYQLIGQAIEEVGLDKDIVGFIDNVDRQATYDMLQQSNSIDVIIPRGSNNLKNFVLSSSQIPVISSAGGNCHVYVEKTADLDMAKKIVYNAKLQRVSVCNAQEQLLVDETIAAKFLPDMLKMLQDGGCKIIGDEEIQKYAKDIIPATEEDYKTEREDYFLTVKVVKDYKEAIDRINANGTKHSEAIVSKDEKVMNIFTTAVDAACVYTNASTRFTDGFEFGFGAEIGISSQKLHARGPLGLEQLTSEKYVITGHGEIRK